MSYRPGRELKPQRRRARPSIWERRLSSPMLTVRSPTIGLPPNRSGVKPLCEFDAVTPASNSADVTAGGTMKFSLGERQTLPEPFHPIANTILKLALLGAAGLVAFVLWTGFLVVRSPLKCDRTCRGSSPCPSATNTTLAAWASTVGTVTFRLKSLLLPTYHRLQSACIVTHRFGQRLRRLRPSTKVMNRALNPVDKSV